jgi:hypothetical protein
MNMNCNEILLEYITKLGNSYSIRPSRAGCILQTRILDPSNDPIEVYISIHEDNAHLSDMGRTVDYLYLNGIDLKANSKQKWYFDSIFKRLQVLFQDDTIILETPLEKIPEGINSLINAITSVNCLIYTGKAIKPVDLVIKYTPG